MLGLGQMGGAIAESLLAAGFEVRGYDPSPACCAALRAAGGVVATSPADAVREVAVAITSLPTQEALEDVLGGSSGLVAGARQPLVVIETSTLDVAGKEHALAMTAGSAVTLLDCPLSGTAAQARRRDVVVYSSGDEDAVERCADVLAGFARSTVHLGAFGNGTRMKLVANHLVTVHNAAAAEAMVLAERCGLDPARALAALTSGAGTSRMLEVRGPSMVAKQYRTDGMRVRTHLKDVRIIGDFARTSGVAVPLFAASAQLYVAAVAQGHGDDDTAAVHAVLAGLAGLPPTTEPDAADRDDAGA